MISLIILIFMNLVSVNLLKVFLIFMSLFSVIISQELEVDGALKINGQIDVAGNNLINLGDPLVETDAVNLRTVEQISSIRPTKIFAAEIISPSTFTVPADKFWKLQINYQGSEYSYDGNHSWPAIIINGNTHRLWQPNGNNAAWANELKTYIFMPNTNYSFVFSSNNPPAQKYFVNIYEYSFTGQGTEQGMNYIVP